MCSRMEEAEFLNTYWEEGLLRRLVEAVRELKALRSLRDRRLEMKVEGGRGAQDGGGGEGNEEEEAGGSPDEEEEAGGSPDEEECMRKVLHVLREVSTSHSDRVTAWSEALRECACVLTKPPAEGSGAPPAPAGD